MVLQCTQYVRKPCAFAMFFSGVQMNSNKLHDAQYRGSRQAIDLLVMPDWDGLACSLQKVFCIYLLCCTLIARFKAKLIILPFILTQPSWLSNILPVVATHIMLKYTPGSWATPLNVSNMLNCCNPFCIKIQNLKLIISTNPCLWKHNFLHQIRILFLVTILLVLPYLVKWIPR